MTISGNFGFQYGIESQIVMILYGMTAVSAIVLEQYVPKMPRTMKQRIVGYVCIAGMFLGFNYLVHVFMIKNGGYPFRPWL